MCFRRLILALYDISMLFVLQMNHFSCPSAFLFSSSFFSLQFLSPSWSSLLYQILSTNLSLSSFIPQPPLTSLFRFPLLCFSVSVQLSPVKWGALYPEATPWASIALQCECRCLWGLMEQQWLSLILRQNYWLFVCLFVSSSRSSNKGTSIFFTILWLKRMP